MPNMTEGMVSPASTIGGVLGTESTIDAVPAGRTVSTVDIGRFCCSCYFMELYFRLPKRATFAFA